MAQEMKVLITGDASSAMGVLDQFAKSVQNTTGQVEGHFNGLGKVVQNLAAPILMITSLMGGTALFGSSIEGTVVFGKEVSALQRVLGGTTGEAAATSMAVKSVFGDVEGYLGATAKMVRTLNTNEEAIKRLGIATRDSNNNFRPAPALISEINAALGKKTEGIARDMAAQSVYGRSWMEMLKYVKLTPEVMAEARIRTRELGTELDEQQKGAITAYRKGMIGIHEDFDALKIRVGLQVMPVLTDLADWFNRVAPSGINVLLGALRTLQDVLGMTSVKVGLLYLAFQGLGGAAILRGITSLGLALGNVFSVALLGASGPLTALEARIVAFLNPTALAVGAFAGLALGLEWLDKAGARAHDRALQEIQDSSKNIATLQGLQKEYAEVAKRLDSGKLSGDAKATALKNLKTIEEQILSIAPEYRAMLEKETDSYVTMAKAIKQVNEDKKKGLESDLAKLEAELKAAQDREARMTEPSSGYSKSAGEGDTGAAIVNVDALRKASERVNLLKDEVRALRTELGKLNSDAKPEGDPGGGGGNGPMTAINKFKADLERTKYLFEKEGFDRGQLLDFSKAKEAAWIVANQGNTKAYAFSSKERAQVDKMLYEARRAAMAQSHKADLDAMKTSMEALKHDAEARLQVAVNLEKQAANPEEAAAARKEQEKIRQEIKDRNTKLQEIELEQKRNHGLALLQLEEDFNNTQKERGLISGMAYLTEEERILAARFQIEKQALEDRLKLEAMEPTERAKIRSQLAALEDKRAGQKQASGAKRTVETEKSDGGAGLSAGIRDYLLQAQNAFQTWRGFATSMLSGTESAFANFFTSLTLKGSTFGEKTRALWQGISGTVIQGLAKIGAQHLVVWGIEKAKLAWDAIRSAWNTADTAKTVTEGATKSAANTGTAATGFFASFAGTGPWGFALAAAAIVAMFALLGSLTGKEKGGPVTGGTPYIVGEAGEELFVPGVSGTIIPHDVLKNAHGNLNMNISRKESQVASLQMQANEYGAQASAQAKGGAFGMLLQDNRGALFIGDTAEGMRKAGAAVRKIQDYNDGRRG